MSHSVATGDWIVLENSEGEYSLWPANRTSPSGWRATGARGSEDECMAYVNRMWAHMTPASLSDTLASGT
jgi:MbtH protein